MHRVIRGAVCELCGTRKGDLIAIAADRAVCFPCAVLVSDALYDARAERARKAFQK